GHAARQGQPKRSDYHVLVPVRTHHPLRIADLLIGRGLGELPEVGVGEGDRSGPGNALSLPDSREERQWDRDRARPHVPYVASPLPAATPRVSTRQPLQGG